VFTSKRQWNYQDFQSGVVCHLGVLQDHSFLDRQRLVQRALNIPQKFNFPTVHQHDGDKDMWYQQYAAPPHYHHNANAHLHNSFPDRHTICWVPSINTRFNPTWIYLVGYLKGTMPAKLQELQQQTGLLQTSEKQQRWPLASNVFTSFFLGHLYTELFPPTHFILRHSISKAGSAFIIRFKKKCEPIPRHGDTD